MRRDLRRRRAGGEGGVDVLIFITIIAAFIYAVFFIPTPLRAAEAPNLSTTTLYISLDGETGCQYLGQRSSSAGVTPRIAADGKTHMGCKGATNAKS